MKPKKFTFSGVQQRITSFDLRRINFLPRSVVVLIDTCLLCLALGIAFLALSAINITFYPALPLSLRIGIILGINLFYFRIFRTYSGLIRHSSFIDIIKIGFAAVATLISLEVLQYLYLYFAGEKIFISVGLILYTVLSFSFLLIFRIFIKQIYHTYKEKQAGQKVKKIAILGIDDNCISLGNTILSDGNREYSLVAFLTKKPLKNISIAGKPVIPVTPSLRHALAPLNLDGVLIIGKQLSVKEKNEIVNSCIALGLQVFNAPLVEEWNQTRDVTHNIKSVEIEDLLDREPIELDTASIKEDLQNETILITGAAGSIGSELVRQIAAYKPKQLILVDQAETPLYTLELELQEKFPELNFKPVLATISNKYRMEALFRKYDFSVVFNAAAYKHVPMIERNPREAIIVNILGTVNLANLASIYRVKKFVMVSTDKAVNPTNVMGASKRAAEMYVQAFQQNTENRTQFITTRFGNVLGSNGSVIPHFRNQIKKGGPVTVTHPDIIRYFMTIPEACQLVLQAGTMGNGGEIFIFDMGKPVKILDLAKRMIRLSGFLPYKDIDIQISGLRPGEKLYEELLSNTTTTLPTHNKKIMISKDLPADISEVEEKTKALIRSAIKAEDKREMVLLLKQLVPEFISKNSEYESLDVKVEMVKVKRNGAVVVQ